MRQAIVMALLACIGCTGLDPLPGEPATAQVANLPFAQSKTPMPVRVNFAPASREVSYRVELTRSRLTNANPQTGLSPTVTAIASADPEIFHTSDQQIYITDALVQQCQTDGQLAAVLAHQFGRLVAEREVLVADTIRQPERLPPISVPIGNMGDSRQADPLNQVEMARFEQRYPRPTTRKLAPPNPHQVARDILDRAGYQRTELDAALPLLQAAQRYSINESQFKGVSKQGEWKMP